MTASFVMGRSVDFGNTGMGQRKKSMDYGIPDFLGQRKKSIDRGIPTTNMLCDLTAIFQAKTHPKDETMYAFDTKDPLSALVPQSPSKMEQTPR